MDWMRRQDIKEESHEAPNILTPEDDDEYCFEEDTSIDEGMNFASASDNLMAYDVKTRLRCSIPSKADLCLRVGVDEGMHFQVIIIAGTVRGPRFGPTPSQLWGAFILFFVIGNWHEPS
ncbi:hypothetical protein ALC53_08046 [Atta colombica]|uniref:Uncharacterized protein n=1 Tax=Atta colombica TaxID=520822 RepID=A0A151I2Q9_9HYME|nr:hypothetical protein ALC53_08046 [Atta colombica]